jgi:hypothetical protein
MNYWNILETVKPNICQQLLVLINGQIAVIAKFDGYYFTEDGLEIENVTHWMYLHSNNKVNII